MPSSSDHISFDVVNDFNSVTCIVHFGQGYASKAPLPPLNVVTITPVSQPSTVTVNGKAIKRFHYMSDSQSLVVSDLNLMMDVDLSLSWD